MGKVAVITGVSRGLGRVIASEFAGHGWSVVGVGRSDRPKDLDASVDYRQFDASNSEDCDKLWAELAREHPDDQFCLVNNAGGYVGGPMVETQASDYLDQMKSIYFAAVFMTRALVKSVPRAKIINVISTGALTARKNESAYGPAKIAEKQFFQTLQKELDDTKYEITNLYPDTIATQGPADRAIDPGDLAHLIRWDAEMARSYYEADVVLRARK